MWQLRRESTLTLTLLIGVLIVLGFLTYSYVSPNGMLADLKNDLADLNRATSTPFVDLDGVLFDLTSVRGKPLIINSWATWMPFSATELPLLEQFAREHSGALVVLAVDRKEEAPVIRAFLSSFGIDDHSSVVFLRDATDSFYTTIGGYAMPETVFYRRDGTIAEHKRGTLTEDELRYWIDAITSDK